MSPVARTRPPFIACYFTLLCGSTALGAPSVGAATEALTESGSTWQVIWNGLEWPAVFIIAGSIAAIALIVDHFLTIREKNVVPAQQIKKAKQLIERRNFRTCLEQMRKSETHFGQLLAAGLHHARHGFEAMHDAVYARSDELSGRMYRRAEYLNILGNLGPLMGLLGTVLGMIKSFGALGVSGGVASADSSGLATGISEALVNTLLGLALAVIGLGFFGVCRNRIDALTGRARGAALDLLEYFRPAPRAAAKTGAESGETAGTHKAAL